MRTNITDDIKGLTEYLRLPTIRNSYVEEAKEAEADNITFEEYLFRLLQKESDYRLERARIRRIKKSNFPEEKYLENLIIHKLPPDGQNKLKLLKSLDFIERGQNVIMTGTTGTGKTHISIGLGIKACNEGYSVLFTKVPLLITQLKENVVQKSLRSFENKFEKYDLVIADELGYITFDREGSELLFTCLSLRAGRKSTIITSNLTFDKWEGLFQDPVMTAAMIDRMTHKSYVVNMIGPSFRDLETEEWLKNGGDTNG